MSASARRRFGVVGAGITGLAAAWELEREGCEVVVLEATARPGGKLAASEVPPLPFVLDEGADAFLARVPEALELCAELGIDDLVHPATGQAWVDTGAGLHPLPRGQLLGVPTDLDELAGSGLVSPAGLRRVRADLDTDWAPPSGDESVGALVRARLGDEVCDHLVEPLLGGINAGEADGLSAAAVAPQIWACAQEGGSLVRAAAALRATAATDAPVFAAPAAGMASIPTRLAERLRGELRWSTPVDSVTTDGAGVRLVGAGLDEQLAGVVITAPADAAGALLADVAPDTSGLLRSIEFASVAMVTLVADASAVHHPLDGSGFVVARTAGRSITACSWGSSKWAHWDDGAHVVLRASLGHDADPTNWCALDDATLVGTVLDDLAAVLGERIEPVGARVGRWPRSFPQYRPGHLELVEQVSETVGSRAPVAVAGASLGGIGVPACIRQGRSAARRLLR